MAARFSTPSYIPMVRGEGLGSTKLSFSVCGCRSWIQCGLFVIFFLSLNPTFSAASSDGGSATVDSPTPRPQPLKSGTRLDSRIGVLLIAAVALFSALLIVMGILKFLSFRIQRRRANRVVVVGDQESGVGLAGDGKDKEGSGLVVREFNWEDIQSMTAKFQSVVGTGGFSMVYLARLSGGGCDGDGGLGAVKVHTGSERLNLAFKQELDVLLRIRHENIVKLIGFCDEEAEGALVFEYIPNGNLQEKLHGRADGQTEQVLPWRNRMLIAFQLARAIEYLHEQCSPQIVHGDIKASNILLDETLSCKLCDFGTAKMGFSSLILPPSSSSSSSSRTKQLMMGSPGYTDPHYIRTGIASKKNDIYSFGVLLLELITGMEAFCSQRGQVLTSLPGLREGDGESVTVDHRLNGDYVLEEVKAMVSLSRLCLQQSPTMRPSATQILETFRDKVSKSIAFTSSPSGKCARTH